MGTFRTKIHQRRGGMPFIQNREQKVSEVSNALKFSEVLSVCRLIHSLVVIAGWCGG